MVKESSPRRAPEDESATPLGSSALSRVDGLRGTLSITANEVGLQRSCACHCDHSFVEGPLRCYAPEFALKAQKNQLGCRPVLSLSARRYAATMSSQA